MKRSRASAVRQFLLAAILLGSLASCAGIRPLDPYPMGPSGTAGAAAIAQPSCSNAINCVRRQDG